MQHRRASQVAESGQLLPRLGSKGQISDHSPTDCSARRSADITESFSYKPSTFAEARAGLLNAPSINIIGSSPPTESNVQAPYDADAEYLRIQNRDGVRQQSQVISEPARSNSGKGSEKKRSSFSVVANKNNPQVLRQVNSGFAILQPGSLGRVHIKPMKASTVHDSDADMEDEMSNRRSGRKLQKRRQSRDSQQSSRKSTDTQRA